MEVAATVLNQTEVSTLIDVQWLSLVEMVDVTRLVLNVCVYHVSLQYSHCIICSEVCCKVPALIENEIISSLIKKIKVT